jgi:hypothetical protein
MHASNAYNPARIPAGSGDCNQALDPVTYRASFPGWAYVHHYQNNAILVFLL